MRIPHFVVLILTILYFQTSSAQSVYEIVCTAFSKGKALTDVTYELTIGEQKSNEFTSKNGSFQFAIKNEENWHSLKVSKSGYISKVIHFDPTTYPFEREYEIQEIDLDFKKGNGDESEIQEGILVWSEIGDVFGVVKYAGQKENKEQESKDEDRLNLVYTTSRNYGDELYASEEFKSAKQHYEISLLASPGDEYVMEKIRLIEDKLKEIENQSEGVSDDLLDKINKGEAVSIKDNMESEGISYSIQLGAFSKTINSDKFKNVPEFRIVQYDDFARCFSGSFANIMEAMQRRKEMQNQGYKDAWIVKMKDNMRIGF